MAPKKRDRDDTGAVSAQNICKQDYERFLQAFEKPTQIYRYLRVRGLLSPLFLQRNLSYMRRSRNCSTNKQKQCKFSVNQLLNKVVETQTCFSSPPDKYLVISYLGVFYNTDIPLPANVCVQTCLNMFAGKRRKEFASPPITRHLRSCDVAVNPDPDSPPTASVPTACISAQCLTGQDGDGEEKSSKWPRLLLCVNLPASCNSENTEPSTCKRRKLSRSNNNNINNINKDINASLAGRTLAPSIGDLSNYNLAQLPLTDRSGRWLLTDAEYDVILQPSDVILQSSDVIGAVDVENSTQQHNKTTVWKHAQDQCVVEDSLSVFDRLPTLKLRIAWCQLPVNASVQRPRPLQPLSANQLTDGRGQHETLTNGTAALAKHSDDVKPESENNPSGTDSGAVVTNVRSAPDPNQHSQNQNSSQDKPRMLVYRFLYGSGSMVPLSTANNEADRVQDEAEKRAGAGGGERTEARRDLICPWCCLNCSRLFSLLKHLQLCHARFMFTYRPVKDIAYIDVCVNDSYDSSYSGNPLYLSRPSVRHRNNGSMKKTSRLHSVDVRAHTGPCRRCPFTALLVCRPRRNCRHLATTGNNGVADTLAEFVQESSDRARPVMSGYNRMYHRTSNNLPIAPAMMDYDSEGEHDHPWLRVKTQRMLNDFSDVNGGEKQVMLLWNLHVMKHNYVGDCQMSTALAQFIQLHTADIVKHGLYRNFLLHVCSLYDFGIISPLHVHRAVEHFQQIVENDQQLTSTLAKHLLKQC